MRILSRGRITDVPAAGPRLLASSRASCFRNFTFFASVVMGPSSPSPNDRQPKPSSAALAPGPLFILAEGHAERPQEFARLVVVGRARHEGHVHALGKGHLVRIDLRENHLLRQADAVVAPAV